MNEKLKESALDYHRHPRPGKIKITPTKALTTQKDLSLAYSPGVAAASELIHENPAEARNMTARANLVGVITNGTAVLGLGDIGPLASKPVMEGKGVLFKKFADIDVFDIEIDEKDPDKLVDIIASLEPTFGGINLEDIKAPEAFIVEEKLCERCNIPIFHDDQHGTAIITAAAIINALEIVGKDIAEVKLAASGAGAAGIACLDLLVDLGMKRENIMVSDRKGVIYTGRSEYMDDKKAAYARETDKRTLEESMAGADVFLGVSVGGLVSQDMVKSMADKPIILALANPMPEIMPSDALAARPDAIIATGRSDFPNQVNNVLCFPYIFRGALDVGATTINTEMKMACVKAIAELARMEITEASAAAYGDTQLQFGPQYLIPKPFDPAPAGAAGAGRGGSRHEQRRGHARDRRPGGLSRKTGPVPVAHRPADEARVRCGPPEHQAHRLFRGRRGSHPARRADHCRRPAGQADPDRTPGGDREPHRETGSAHQAGRGLRSDQPGVRSAILGLLDDLSRAHGAQRRVA